MRMSAVLLCRQQNEFQSIGCRLLVNQRRASAVFNGTLKIMLPYLSTALSRGAGTEASGAEGDFDEIEPVSHNTSVFSLPQKYSFI